MELKRLNEVSMQCGRYQTRINVPRFLGVHELPVSNGYVVPAFAADRRRFASSNSARTSSLAVHLACTKPRNVAIAVVRLIFSGNQIIRVCEFAFDDAAFTRLGDLVIVDNPPSANDNSSTEFAEDGSCNDHTDVASLVAAGQDLSLDQVLLLRVVDENLVKLRVLGEEEVTVSETATTCRLSRKHIKPLAATLDCECADAVFATALQVAVLVDLFVSFVVLVDLRLVVHHVVFVALEDDMRRLWRCSLSPSSEASATRSYRPSSLALERRAGLAAILAHFGSTNVSLWWSAWSSSSPSPPWDRCNPRRTVSIIVVVVRRRRMRVVLVLAGAVVGCRIAGSFGISIVASIDHLVVGSIVSDYRRRASCSGGGVSGCRDDDG